MKSTIYTLILITGLSMVGLSCTDDDNYTTVVEPLNLDLAANYETEMVTNETWRDNQYTLANSYNRYSIENIIIDAGVASVIPFSLDNDDLGSFDIYVNYVVKDGQPLLSSDFATAVDDFSVNGQTLLNDHPNHPSKGVFMELGLNNVFLMSFQQVGNYEVEIILEKRELGDKEQFISRAKVVFDYTVQ